MRSWIKLHTLKLDDVRILRLHERAQLRFYQLYLLAGRLDQSGCFIENGQKLSEQDLALKLRIKDHRLFKLDLKSMKEAGLLKVNGHGPFIADFKEEQVDWDHKRELDRERQQRRRENTVTRDTSVTVDGSQASHAPRPDQDQTKTKIKIKTKPTTHIPPSKKGEARGLAGGVAGDGSDSDFTPSERKIAESIKPVLQSAGLGQPRFETLLHKVATQLNLKSALTSTLAALASSYADEKVNNKVIVAAHRLESNTIPAEYFNPDKWTAIPASVLKSAGIEDLQQYIAKNKPMSDYDKRLASIRARAERSEDSE